MIDFTTIVPTMEQAMQGSVVFAALTHGLNTWHLKISRYLSDRRWNKLLDETKAEAVADAEALKTKVEAVVETVKTKKNEKNG